ncbi:MAG: site-specific integrase [Eggerthellaceae bacterium]|nr:site-specific integrase [Eggerthellaceae bacterium]
MYKAGDGVWRVCVEAGRDPKTGKRKRTTRTVRGSRKQAERVKAELLAKAGSSALARERLTVSELFDRYYLPYCEKHLRATTVYAYEKNYRRLVEPYLGNLLVEQVTPLTVETWLGSIDGASRRFEAYKLLRQIMSKAVKWDLADTNPCSRVEAPKKEAYRPDVLDAATAEKYVEHARGTEAEPIVLLAIGGGFRRSEIAALDWEDISENGAVVIDNAITSVGGRTHEDTTKTEFGKRTVHLPASFAARLNELRGTGPVMLHSKGGRLSPNGVTRVYTLWRDTLPPDIKRITLKNLRHTSLTLALEGGADILAVSRRAGHATIGITSAYYLRPHESVDVAAAEGLDNLLKNG